MKLYSAAQLRFQQTSFSRDDERRSMFLTLTHQLSKGGKGSYDRIAIPTLNSLLFQEDKRSPSHQPLSF